MLRLSCLVGLFLAVLAFPAGAADFATGPHVRVELLTEKTLAQNGVATTVGVRFVLEPDWHVYWRNPGDSGEAVRVVWTLPEGMTAGAIEWPRPTRFPIGPLVNYGYSGEVLLPVTLTVPATIPSGSNLVLAAKVDWLVCKEECIPGSAQLDTMRGVGGTPAEKGEKAPLFAAARAATPVPLPASWLVDASATGAGFELAVSIDPLPASKDVYFFPQDRGVLAHAAAQTAEWTERGVKLKLVPDENLATPPAKLQGVLAVDGRFFDIAPALTRIGAPKTASAAAAPITLLHAILLAFVGGLILNCMPCVFPILSIKAFGLLKHAHESRAKAKAHGLLYGLGVLVSFWALAGTLLALRAGGEQLGWGFQLQSPISILALALLLFAMGLNLAGAFEIRAGWVGIGQGLASRQEAVGAFFSGVLATVVATPCTAPFMGTALGYAAAQPAAVALAVFTSLAVGLAAPYVLLSWFPHAGKLLPRPGRWMETMKQVMAFPLFATVIWLLWVLGRQSGPNGIAGALAACLVVAIAGWIYQRWQAGLGTAIAALTFVGAVVLGIAVIRSPLAAPPAQAAAAVGWTPYTPASFDELRAKGTPVFLDFTAAWCVTCKVNELVALGPTMLTEMRSRGITPMQADWTNDDPAITAALRTFGRDGVPLYVLYGGKDAEPKILPQILSTALVLEALDDLKL